MKLPRFIRLLIAYLLGDDDRRVPKVPDGLPLDVAPVVDGNVRLLTEYQDAEYARLYMDRLGRFMSRRGVDSRMLGEIASLLAGRMAYEDLIWHAQQRLAQGNADRQNNPLKPTWREIVSMLPPKVASPAITALEYPGWIDAIVTISMTTDSWRGRLAVNAIASLRRLRPQSVRYTKERPLVERWLHMIDRALTKQPSAAWEVLGTARLLCGHGNDYKCAVANWHLMIDGLAKPAFDGNLELPDLGQHLARLQEIAAADPSGRGVRQEIARIKAELAHAA
jgi:hypothetical protein